MRLITSPLKQVTGRGARRHASRSHRLVRDRHEAGATAGALVAGIGLGVAARKLDERRRHVAHDMTTAADRDSAGETVRKADFAAGKSKDTAHPSEKPTDSAA